MATKDEALEKVPQPAGSAGPDKPPPGSADSGSSLWAHIRNWIGIETELGRIKRLEEGIWTSEQSDILRVAWLLRMQHAEAKLRARASQLVGLSVTAGGAGLVAVAVRLVFKGREHMASLVPAPVGWSSAQGTSYTQIVVPERLWELIIATSSGVVLILGAAALLFHVARDYYQRYLEHSREMDAVRGIEAAVRLCLSTRSLTSSQEQAKQALLDVSAKLIERYAVRNKSKSPQAAAELSSVAKDFTASASALSEAVAKTAEAVSKVAGRKLGT